MTLRSPRFSWHPRLRSAEMNRPAMRRGEEGDAVRLIQQALIDLGYPLPISVREYGSPDGIYGPETEDGVMAFQRFEPPLRVDGIVGRNTMGALDRLLPNPAPRLPPPGRW